MGRKRAPRHVFVCSTTATFPDVRLQNSSDPSDVILGIELKGWYLLAKEEEPSLRFLSTHRKSPIVVVSDRADPYPAKGDEILDRAEDDSGRNFGRIARCGLMDDFVEAAGARLLSGIPARYWRRFLKMFTETAAEANIDRIMAGVAREVAASWEGSQTEETVDAALERLRRIGDALARAGE